jgi:hypothetical protein
MDVRRRSSRRLVGRATVLTLACVLAAGGAWGAPAIILKMNVRVADDPGTTTCGGAQSLEVPWGEQVEICYEVANTGTVGLALHDLVDSQLGTILAGYPLPLCAGCDQAVTVVTEVREGTVFEGTWTAYNPGPTDAVSAVDSVAVRVSPPLELRVTVAPDTSPQPDCDTASVVEVAAGTAVDVCYVVENRSAVTFTLHDLYDAVFGQLLAGYPLELQPGNDTVVTLLQTVVQPTVYQGTWTAYNPGPTDEVSASAVARVVLAGELVFTDGFELGDTGGWSAATPP